MQLILFPSLIVAFLLMQCPVVFAISDNGLSISLKDKGWIHELLSRVAMKKFVADGSNAQEVHAQAKAAIDYSRTYRRPSLLVRTRFVSVSVLLCLYCERGP